MTTLKEAWNVLSNIKTPEAMGSRHRPFSHQGLLEDLQETFCLDWNHKIDLDLSKETAKRPRGATMALTFSPGLEFDLPGLPTGEGPTGEMRIGIIHDNSQRKSLQIVGGTNIFICSNLMVIGDQLVRPRRHTTRFTRAARQGLLYEAGEIIQAKADRVKERFNRLEGEFLPGFKADSILLDAAREGIIPSRLAVETSKAFRETLPEAPTSSRWKLEQALTRALQTTGESLTRRMVISQRFGKVFLS